MSTPRTPPEWAPQSAIWLGWPSRLDLWEADLIGAREEVVGLVRALAPRVRVKVAASSDAAAQSARAAIGSDADVRIIPMGDIWLRDTGPVFAVEDGRLVAQSFVMNGWGGKFILDGDAETAAALAREEGAPRCGHDFVLEGGAIEQDGAGRLITTRQCLLNPNRNPGWDEAAAEAALRGAFGVRDVIWLDQGLLGDHTDGHVDNIARFIGPGRVVCQAPLGLDDPNAKTLAAIERDLRATGLEVHTLPSPGRVDTIDGEPAPASHLNFVMANRLIVVPVYETDASAHAVAALRRLCPGHDVTALPAKHVLTGGGAFHCLTQHVPAVKRLE
ncbi:MAG: agmatine deiminase family protein [Pseudomonadota bacterium]